jgi:hypothetical protein
VLRIYTSVTVQGANAFDDADEQREQVGAGGYALIGRENRASGDFDTLIWLTSML